MYFITTVEEKDGDIVDRRCVGYVDTLCEAEKIVVNNEYDIFEYCYNYAVIEAIPSGVYQYDQAARWYRIVFKEENSYYERIEKPKWADTVGWAIG
jgi:hypothetical protein